MWCCVMLVCSIVYSVMLSVAWCVFWCVVFYEVFCVVLNVCVTWKKKGGEVAGYVHRCSLQKVDAHCLSLEAWVCVELNRFGELNRCWMCYSILWSGSGSLSVCLELTGCWMFCSILWCGPGSLSVCVELIGCWMCWSILWCGPGSLNACGAQ